MLKRKTKQSANKKATKKEKQSKIAKLTHTYQRPEKTIEMWFCRLLNPTFSHVNIYSAYREIKGFTPIWCWCFSVFRRQENANID